MKTKKKIKEVLDEQIICHPSRHNEQYIKKLCICVELLADRVDYLEGLTSRSVKVKGGKRR